MHLWELFNIPEKYIANNEENPSEATEYLKEQGQINEEWNDKYIQNYSVEKATTGVSWYSFDVDTLEGTMYTKASIVMEEQMMTWKAICTEL